MEGSPTLPDRDEPSIEERSRGDIARGEPWPARDRPLSVITERPAQHDLYDVLGEAYFAMNDLGSS